MTTTSSRPAQTGHAPQPKVDPQAVTISGVVLDPTYGPQNPAESLTHIDRDLGKNAQPGAYPYTRGLFP